MCEVCTLAAIALVPAATKIIAKHYPKTKKSVLVNKSHVRSNNPIDEPLR